MRHRYEVSPEGLLPEVRIGLTGVEEVLQNVAVILATPKGSVPLDRDFGTSWMFLDAPTPKALAGIRAEIIESLRRYEPRVHILAVRFEAHPSAPEKIYPVVTLEISAS